MASSTKIQDLVYSGNFSKSGSVPKGVILVGDSTIFSLLSVGPDGQILIADSSEDTGLLWVALSLTSAGGVSLVSDGSGHELQIRGLSAGTGITVTNVGTSLQIASNAAASPYQQSGSDITPVSAGTNAVLSGLSNTAGSQYAGILGGSSNTTTGTGSGNVIAGSVSCSLIGPSVSNSVIVGSDTCSITGDSGIRGQRSFIAASTNSHMLNDDGGANCSIISCSLAGINSDGIFCSIIACNNSAVTSNGTYCAVIASEACSITNPVTRNSSIVASDTCSIGGGSGVRGRKCFIAASTNSHMISNPLSNNSMLSCSLCNIPSEGAFCSIIACNDSSVANDGTYCAVIASETCSVIGSVPTNTAIVASDTCSIRGASGTNGQRCFIAASINSHMINDPGDNNSILSCSLCNIPSGGTFCSIIACNDSSVASSGTYCAIIASEACDVDSLLPKNTAIIASDTCSARRAQKCFIAASNDSHMTTAGGTMGVNNSMISCNLCNIPDVGGHSAIIASNTSTVVNDGSYSALIAGTNSSLSGTISYSTCIGSNSTVSHSGNFLFSDSAGGTALNSSGNHRFSARCSGGAIFNTNTMNTTGVTLAAGGGAWVMISDRNKKENLVELSYEDILSKVDKLPIYSYNFIGNPTQQKCMGPMAQDWHGSDGFPLDPVEEEIEDPENPGETVKIQKDAKDKLGIDTMDMLGVCLASIKALVKQNNQLQAQVQDLSARVSKLETPM